MKKKMLYAVKKDSISVKILWMCLDIIPRQIVGIVKLKEMENLTVTTEILRLLLQR